MDRYDENYDYQFEIACDEMVGQEFPDDLIPAFEAKLKELLGERYAGELSDEESLVLTRQAMVAIGLRVRRR